MVEVVIEWHELYGNCKNAKETKEHNVDVRVCALNRYAHCRPDWCPLLKKKKGR